MKFITQATQYIGYRQGSGTPQANLKISVIGQYIPIHCFSKGGNKQKGGRVVPALPG